MKLSCLNRLREKSCGDAKPFDQPFDHRQERHFCRQHEAQERYRKKHDNPTPKAEVMDNLVPYQQTHCSPFNHAQILGGPDPENGKKAEIGRAHV